MLSDILVKGFFGHFGFFSVCIGVTCHRTESSVYSEARDVLENS